MGSGDNSKDTTELKEDAQGTAEVSSQKEGSLEGEISLEEGSSKSTYDIMPSVEEVDRSSDRSDFSAYLKRSSVQYGVVIVGVLVIAIVFFVMRGVDSISQSPSDDLSTPVVEYESKEYDERIVEEVRDEVTGEVKSVIVSSSGVTITPDQDDSSSSLTNDDENSDASNSETTSDTEEVMEYLDLEVLSLSSAISALGDVSDVSDLTTFGSKFSEWNAALLASIEAVDSSFMQDGFMQPEWLLINLESLNNLQLSIADFWSLKVDDESFSTTYGDLLLVLQDFGVVVESYAKSLQVQDIKEFSDSAVGYEDLKILVRSKLQEMVYLLNLPTE